MNSSLIDTLDDEHLIKLNENPTKFGFYLLLIFTGLIIFLSSIFLKSKNNHVKIFFTCAIVLLLHFGTPPIFLGLLCLLMIWSGNFK